MGNIDFSNADKQVKKNWNKSNGIYICEEDKKKNKLLNKTNGD